MAKTVVKILGSVLFTAILVAAPAWASTLLQVVEIPQGDNINTVLDLTTFDAIDESDLFSDDGTQLLFTTSVSEDCEFGVDTACSFDFDEGTKYAFFKAGNYGALYEVGSVVDVNVADWGPLFNGGGRLYLPALSDGMAVSVPEPSAALVFCVGLGVAGYASRRRRAA